MPGRAGSSYISEVAGWQEFNQPADTLWYEVPAGSSIQDLVNPYKVEAVWVHTFNPDIAGDEHWFWVYTYTSLDWDQWDNLIAGIMDMHNMAMA